MAATNDNWRVTMAAIVGAIPPTVAALAVHMRVLIRRESNETVATSTPVVTARPDTLPSIPPARTPISVQFRVDVPAPSTTDTNPSSVDSESSGTRNVNTDGHVPNDWFRRNVWDKALAVADLGFALRRTGYDTLMPRGSLLAVLISNW